MQGQADYRLVLVGLLASFQLGYADFADCTEPLGMESGDIPDHAIHASSYYDRAVGPQHARIDTEVNGGAWCPKEQITPDVHEWLEIDLQTIKVITSVATQGRFANSKGQEYTEAYTLSYQRLEGGPWHNYSQQSDGQQTVFKGNSNTYQPERRDLRPPIIARRLRISPRSTHPRMICLRAEVYGCPWTADAVSYSMPQGDARGGAELDLRDLTYDGTQRGGVLSGGLGQLMDGSVGDRHPRGADWVGWRNDSAHPRTAPVALVFRFAHVRNFSAVWLHCSNQFGRGVRVFREARVLFSVGGRHFGAGGGGGEVVFPFTRDDFMERSRPVIVPVPHRIAMYVRIELHFDDRWMMISEVSFVSEIALGNFSEETGGLARSDGQPTYVEVDSLHNTGLSGGASRVPPLDSESGGVWWVAIVSGSLATLLLLFIVVIVVVAVRCRHRKAGVKTCGAPAAQHVAGGQRNGTRDPADRLLYNSIATDDVAAAAAAARLPNGDTYRQPIDMIQRRKLPDLPDTLDLSDGNISQVYAVPDVAKTSFKGPGLALLAAGLAPGPGGAARPLIAPVCERVYLQGQSGNSLCAVPTCLSELCTGDLALCEFPRQNLRFIDRLGGGQFGEVHLCEAVDIAEYVVDDSLALPGGSTLVTAKLLLHNADPQAREEFVKEIRIMSRLSDVNIVRVLALCSEGEPLCVLVEYMKHGDLKQFLQKCVSHEDPSGAPAAPGAVSSKPGTPSPRVSYGCLIYMAGQIASGMKYLESLNIVHRDLAARNCLVGHNYLIKISDFGMSRSLYDRDYYKIEGRAVLPIRWMAWESVLLGKFSTKSDVWSFAVTLWEVLSLARRQPYEPLADQDVIENCVAFYRADGSHCCLAQPANCPKEIYDLMRECWQADAGARPTFREMHMFLQRKNIGYTHSRRSIDDLAIV